MFILNLLKIGYTFFIYRKSISFRNIYFNLIIYFTIFNICLYGILVNIFRLISNSKILKEYGVSTHELFYVELLEFFSSFLFLTLLYFFFRSSFGKKVFVSSIEVLAVFPLLALFNILSIFNNFVSDANNEFLFGETIKYISGPSAVLLTFFSIKYKRYFFLILSIPNLVLIIFLVFSTGVRGPMLGIILIIVFLYISNYSFRDFLKKVPLIIFPIFFIMFFNNEYSKIKFAFAKEYISNPKAYQSIVDIGGFIIDFYRYGNSEIIDGSSSSISDEIEFRLGARSMYSVGFLRFANNQGYVYGKPIFNTLFVFFPRAIFNENKPYPDSYNGEISGMGMYVCANVIDGQVNMTDFYSSSHYYWQFGILGVLVFTVLSTIYLILISIFTSKFDDIFKLFFLLVALKPYYFIPQLTISDTILMTFTKILPLLFIYKLLIFFRRFKFKV